MTEWIEQWMYIKFCMKLEHSLVETIQMIQKATAIGNWQLAASSQQCICSCIRSHAEFFGETSNHPGDSAPLPRFGALWHLTFPKTKITFERKEISDCWWDSENMMGQLMAIGRTAWGPKVPTLKRTDASLSYVQCIWHLISSLINVFIFHSAWLDTFWTDLIHTCIHMYT